MSTDDPLPYATAARRLSRSGVGSAVAGLLVWAHFLCVAHYGLPPDWSDAQRWAAVGPSYLLDPTGFVLGVVAIVGQRRLWWLGIVGLLLNGLMMAVIGLLVLRRYG